MDHMEMIRQEIKAEIAKANEQSDTAEGDDRAFVLGKLSAYYSLLGFIAGVTCGEREIQIKVLSGYIWERR